MTCLAILSGGCLPAISADGPPIRAQVIRGQAGDQLVFPEKSLSSSGLRGWMNRTGDNGICFSGGGTRAMMAGAGCLRALTSPELNLIRSTRYLSCVSGGSWLSATFSYYRVGPKNDTEYLGAIVTDAERRSWKFSAAEGPSWASLTEQSIGHTATAEFGKVLEKALHDGPKHEAWQRAVGEVFFKPFGIAGAGSPRFFSFDVETVDHILRENRTHHPDWTRNDFATLRLNRPYLVVNATILWPIQMMSPINRVNLQFTPLGVGNAAFVPLEVGGLAGKQRQPTGAGYTAPFAFDSMGPDEPPVFDENGVAWSEMTGPAKPFSIWKASGMSSAAYAADLGKLDKKILPMAQYWAVGEAGKATTRSIRIGDGENIENLGLLALLQRQVKRIVVLNSAEHTLDEVRQFESPTKDGEFAPLFGYTTDAAPNNTVFPKAAYHELITALSAERSAGRLPMVKRRYQVAENSFWGIKPYEVEILWIYNDLSTNWADQLDPSVKAIVLEGANDRKGPLKDFPNYRTIAENKMHLIELTPQQVTLLADMYDWSLRQPQARKLLQSMLGAD